MIGSVRTVARRDCMVTRLCEKYVVFESKSEPRGLNNPHEAVPQGIGMATLLHPHIKGGVEGRAYQLRAAKDALSGSTLMVMPTGFGKTAVEWMAMAEYIDKEGKILLIAPSTGLIHQHAQMVNEKLNLTKDDICILTGDIKPEKRPELWNNAKLILATPQVIRNDSRNGIIDISEVALLIVDEAHHATGSHAMAEVGDIYQEARMDGLVLAATASPGVKEEKVLEIIQRLGIERLHLANREDELLKPYATEMNVEEHRIDSPTLLIELITPLLMLEEEEADILKRGGFLVANQRVTTATIEEAHRRASAAIRRGDKRGYDAAKKIADLRRLHRLVDLLRSQGVLCARAYLDRAEEEGRSSRKTGRFLSLPQVNLLRQRIEKMDEIHPKPALVQRSIRQSLRRNPEGRIIVFTEYRDTVDILCNLLSTDSRLQVGRFVGQTNKGARSGMNQKKQLEQLSRFREGELNILVATSVAEEGLDVPSADRVILYEPVPSAIRAIQRRGRTARQRSGDVHILISNGSRDEFVQRAAEARETRMHSTLNRIIKQARLPRRSPPDGNLLNRFKILRDDDEISATDFIKSECDRLLTKDTKPDKHTIESQNKSYTKDVKISSRPRTQMSLESFVDDGSNVSDDTKAQADSSAAAMSEIDAMDPEKKRRQD